MTKSLQKYLIDQNLTINNIAAGTGISRQWVSRLLNGHYRVVTNDNALKRISAFMGLTVGQLNKLIHK